MKLDLNNLKKDQEILIPAWWRKNEPTLCKILTIYDKGFTVRPLEGNPHMRYISIELNLGMK